MSLSMDAPSAITFPPLTQLWGFVPCGEMESCRAWWAVNPRMDPSPLQKHSAEDDHGHGEIDDQPCDIDERRHKGSRGTRRVEAQPPQDKRQHGPGQGAKEHHPD